MAKTNAERQKEYRERKKSEGPKYLDNERKRQKKYYVKTKDISKKELKDRRDAVKMRVRKYRKFIEEINSPVNTSATNDESPLVVSMSFPNKGESSRKRKKSRENRLQRKISKLEKEKDKLTKSNGNLRVRIHRMRRQQNKSMDDKTVTTPRKSVNRLLRKNGLTPRKASDDIKKSLLFSEVLSSEIKESTREKKNARRSIRRLISGKILRKYKLLKYAADKTGNDRRKMAKVNSKVLNISKNKRGFDPNVYKEVIEFYNRDDVSTALPGKKDVKSVASKQRKRIRIQKRTLNDYLSNLYEKLKTEKPFLKLSFSNFARMRPANFMLANFVNRRSCLCTQHQNLALKLKMLKRQSNLIPSHPDVFIKSFKTEDEILNILNECSNKQFSYEEWKKVPIEIKSKSGEVKTIKKMKIVQQTKNKAEFIELFLNDVTKFRGHAGRIKNQYFAQKTLKESLDEQHVYIHMDFAEDYRCRSQEEIQSAYWSQTQVTIHPVVAYYKQDDTLCHQSYVFISDEPNHDAKFVFALLRKLVPELVKLIPGLNFVHYWTDSPTSQYRNKTIFKIVSCHEEFFNVLASWNYMEAGHGKGPCDPIGGTAKRKADLAVKNDKAVIQDATDFYTWAKGTEETSAIKYFFVSSSDYTNAVSFLSTACQNIKTVVGTMKLHAVLPHAPNKIWVRENSCFGYCCFKRSIQKDTKCDGWRLVDLKAGESNADKDDDKAVDESVVPDIDDYVAAVYDKKVYIGKITVVDETDANIKFYEHTGDISNHTIFREPRRKDEVWVEHKNILCVLPSPTETKRGRKFEESIISMIHEQMNIWKKKN